MPPPKKNKEQTTDAGNNMNKSQKHYTEQKNPDIKKQLEPMWLDQEQGRYMIFKLSLARIAWSPTSDPLCASSSNHK